MTPAKCASDEREAILRLLRARHSKHYELYETGKAVAVAEVIRAISRGDRLTVPDSLADDVDQERREAELEAQRTMTDATFELAPTEAIQ